MTLRSCALLLALLITADVIAQDPTPWNPQGVPKDELAARALACSDPTSYELRTRIIQRSGRTVVARVTAQNTGGASTPEKICWELTAVDNAGRSLATQSFRVPTRLERDGIWEENVTFHGIDAASVARITDRRIIQTLPPPSRMVVDQAQANDLVAGYLRTYNIGGANLIAANYRETVDVPKQGRITRAALVAQKEAQRKRWDRLTYDLLGIDTITPVPHGLTVAFRLRRWGIDHDGNASATSYQANLTWVRDAYGAFLIDAETFTTITTK